MALRLIPLLIMGDVLAVHWIVGQFVKSKLWLYFWPSKSQWRFCALLCLVCCFVVPKLFRIVSNVFLLRICVCVFVLWRVAVHFVNKSNESDMNRLMLLKISCIFQINIFSDQMNKSYGIIVFVFFSLSLSLFTWIKHNCHGFSFNASFDQAIIRFFDFDFDFDFDVDLHYVFFSLHFPP